MSTDREVTSIVRSWLEEGSTVLPDRVLDAVLDQIPATPQRRASRPAWRLPYMNTQARNAIAAAAVVVLALIVLNILPKAGGVGGPTLAPSPSASPSGPVVLDGAETNLTPGTTYVGGEPFLVHVTFKVPAGWEGVVGGPYAVFLDNAPKGFGAVSMTIFTDVYANPCNNKLGLLNPLPGPTVDDLATALAKLPSLNASTPAAVTLGGYQGKELTLTAPASFTGCTLSSDGAYRIWELPLGATNDLTTNEIDKIWILDVGGQRLVIDSPQVSGETSTDEAEAQSVLDSIQLAPGAPVSSGAPSTTP